MAGHAGAYKLKNSLFTLETVEYQGQVNRVRLVPDTPVDQLRTLDPDGVITDVDSATWVLEIQGVQDHETAGLALFLATNAGTLVDFEFAPINVTGKKRFHGQVRAVPVTIGGDQGEWSLFEVSLPVDGTPAIGTVPA